MTPFLWICLAAFIPFAAFVAGIGVSDGAEFEFIFLAVLKAAVVYLALVMLPAFYWVGHRERLAQCEADGGVVYDSPKWLDRCDLPSPVVLDDAS